MPTICVAGKNNIAIDVLEHLLANYPQYNIVVIPNKNDSGRNGFQKSFKKYFETKGLPVVSLEECYKVEQLIFLSLEFDRIVKPELFSSKQLFNIHFSLLPAYKGMFTSAWPILNDEVCSGVTLHEIDRGIDTGPIIAQTKIDLEANETARSLYFKYIKFGTQLVIENLKSLLSGEYQSSPQPSFGSSYYSKSSINYAELKIDLNKTASEIDRQIRAFSFREFQLPKIHGYPINKVEILATRTGGKAGSVVEDNDASIEICSIDFNLKLYKDYCDRLWKACERNDLAEAKSVIHLVPDLEVKTREGWTALMIASYNGSLEIVDFLISSGADINATNYNNTTVLMYAKSGAVQKGSLETLKRVLRAKPQVECRDIWGKTVLDYVHKENAQIYDLIKESLST